LNLRGTEALPNVLIFREEMLAMSETFIESQALSLATFKPIFIGLRRSRRNLALGAIPLLLVEQSWKVGYARAMLYRALPISPIFHKKALAARASLIHAHFALDGAVALTLQKKLNIPLVVSLHGWDITTSDEGFRRTARGRYFLAHRKAVWDRTAKFICVSKAIYSAALEAGIPEHKLVVHYTGIDLARFKPQPELKRDRESILFVGRLVEKKGCEYLLRAVSLLQQRGVPVHATIVGNGPLRQNLEALARNMAVPARFLGAQPKEEVSRLIATARVLCVPSVTAASGDREGFGMVFAEAQAMGTPVVSTVHSAIPEVVLDGRTGLLAPERDPEALAACISRFLNDDTFWSECSSSGIEHVRRHFGLAEQALKLEAIYTSVIAEHERETKA
jgi:colanic acid/amylovoran biosynthesis glycosyltransferase